MESGMELMLGCSWHSDRGGHGLRTLVRSLHVRWNFSPHILHQWGCTLASQKNCLLKDKWPLGKGVSPMPQSDIAFTLRKIETHSSRIKKSKVPPFPIFCSSRREVEGWHSQPWMLLMPLCQNLTLQLWSAVSSPFTGAPCGFQAHLIH